MTVTHTPGPWTVEQDVVRNGDIHIFAAESLGIADVDVREYPEESESIPREIALANARLMAAAPRLLEALRYLANEASGFLVRSDAQRHRVTNSRVLRLRIEEACDAIVMAEAEAKESKK